ncbi:MAG: NAD(P)H-dependent oxidoreductase [Pseudomonadota bacterium]
MAKVLLYYAHPGARYSRVNSEMQRRASEVDGITRVDLYARYPRHKIDIDAEQGLLRDHEIIVFQFPLFWYSTPSIIKEWQDLVLEHGFAYGTGGTELAGKSMMLACTAAGPEDAYRPEGYQHFPLRTFLSPLEQTARLCQMHFLAPYVLYSSLKAPDTGDVAPHAEGFVRLLGALRDNRYDTDRAAKLDIVTATTLPMLAEA